MHQFAYGAHGFWFEEIDGSDAPAAAAAVSPEVYLYDVAGFTQFKQSRPPIVCTLDEEVLHVDLRHASLAALARLGAVSRLWYGVLLRVHGGGALFDMCMWVRDRGILKEYNFKVVEDCGHLLHVNTDIGNRKFVDLGVVVDPLGARLKTECRYGDNHPILEQLCACCRADGLGVK